MTKQHKRRRKKRFLRCVRRCIRMGMFLLTFATAVLVGMKFLSTGPFSKRVEQPEIEVKLLTQNDYSRPGTRSEKIKNIVIHYTANPGTTAVQNRNYFENLKEAKTTKASSHFIVGLKGEIVQCVPIWEVAYASNDRNVDTVSIETCHKTADGSYTKETYRSLVQLTAWLCEKFHLSEEDVIRHYDITGKICPKYFVENETAWETFQQDVKKVLEES